MARRFQVVVALQADAQRQSTALQDVLQEAARRGLASHVRAFWASPVIAARASPNIRRLAWAVLAVPQKYYFPFLGNNSNIVRNQNPASE